MIWSYLHARAAALGLHIGREDPRVACLVDIESVSGERRYARIIVPRNEGVSDEERDALLRVMVAAGIEAIGDKT